MSRWNASHVTGSGSLRYRPEIDGLRAVAVALVILFHSGINVFPGGFVGVDVFFVISGYLITAIICREHDSGGFSFLSFYTRRVLRLLPVLFLVLLVTSVAAFGLLLPSDALDFSKSLVAVMVFSSNILFAFEGNYFSRHVDMQPLLHTWSLGVEEQYYLVFPIFLTFLLNWGRQVVLPAMLLACASSLLFAETMAYLGYSNAAFYLLPARGWALLAGASLALYLETYGSRHSLWKLNLSSVVGLFLIVSSASLFDKTTPFPSVYGSIPVVGSVLCIAAAVPGTFVYGFLTQRIIVKLGVISYSAYLWHQPLFVFAKYRFVGDFPELLSVASVLLIIFLSYFSWRFIEIPCLAKGAPQKQRTVLLALCIIAAGIAVLGAQGIRSDGWPGRFGPEENRAFEQYKEYGLYVRSRFGRLTNQDFDASPETTNVLIVGDSFAQDLVNAIYEADLHGALSLSTYYIPARCGVLLGDDLVLDEFVPRGDRSMCQRLRSSKGLMDKVSAADEVWIASSWKPWVLPFIPISERNIRERTEARIKVFGRKHFGERDVRDFFRSNSISSLLESRALSAEHVSVSQKLKELLSRETQYVDVSLLLCDSYEFCGNDDGQGRPLSPDGSHLTRAGAKALGKKLKQELFGGVPTTLNEARN